MLLDWMPLGTPPGFAEALKALQDPEEWSATRAQLLGLWSAGVDRPEVLQYPESMSADGFPMWSRAGREILQSFAAEPTPLAEFAALAARRSPCLTAHLFAQPRDDSCLFAQQAFAAQHDWFRVHRLPANSHFPCLEVPAEICRYRAELRQPAQAAAVERLRDVAQMRPVILLTATKSVDISQAAVLADVLREPAR